MKIERPLTILFALSLMSLLFLACLVNSSYAKLYRWTDEKGQEHITDYPPPGSTGVEREKAGEKVKEEKDRGIIPDAIRKAAPYLSAVPESMKKTLEKAYGFAGALLSRKEFFAACIAAVMLAHLYFSLCLYLISRKVGSRSAFLSWIPALNMFQMTAAAGWPWWWGVAFFLPFAGLFPFVYINFAMVFILLFCSVLALVLLCRIWMKLSMSLWINRWSGLLILLPIIQLIFIGFLAFKKELNGEQGEG